jgi:hypothetical protein
MRNMFAAIARVLAAMPRFVLERVKEGGKWIMRLVAGPAPAPEPMPLPAAAVDDLATLKTAAGVLAQGNALEPGHIKGLSEQRVLWLRTLDRRQLCVLMSRKDEDLKAHLKDEVKLPGLPAADRATVAALVEARKPKPSARGYRTMRDRLAEIEADKADEPTSAWAPAL